MTSITPAVMSAVPTVPKMFAMMMMSFSAAGAAMPKAFGVVLAQIAAVVVMVVPVVAPMNSVVPPVTPRANVPPPALVSDVVQRPMMSDTSTWPVIVKMVMGEALCPAPAPPVKVIVLRATRSGPL